MESGSPNLLKFRDELSALINKYREGPLDDRLNYVEICGLLDFERFDLMCEARDMAEQELEDE